MKSVRSAGAARSRSVLKFYRDRWTRPRRPDSHHSTARVGRGIGSGARRSRTRARAGGAGRDGRPAARGEGGARFPRGDVDASTSRAVAGGNPTPRVRLGRGPVPPPRRLAAPARRRAARAARATRRERERERVVVAPEMPGDRAHGCHHRTPRRTLVAATDGHRPRASRLRRARGEHSHVLLRVRARGDAAAASDRAAGGGRRRRRHRGVASAPRGRDAASKSEATRVRRDGALESNRAGNDRESADARARREGVRGAALGAMARRVAPRREASRLAATRGERRVRIEAPRATPRDDARVGARREESEAPSTRGDDDIRADDADARASRDARVAAARRRERAMPGGADATRQARRVVCRQRVASRCSPFKG